MPTLNTRTFAVAAITVLAFGAPLFFGPVVTLVVTPALAQSSQDMSLLTEQEREEFSRRLQLTASSAGRAKITAEMNRVVQERRLDLRLQKDRTDQSGQPGQPDGAGIK